MDRSAGHLPVGEGANRSLGTSGLTTLIPSASRSLRSCEVPSAVAVILRLGFARVLGLRATWRATAGDALPPRPSVLRGCMKARRPPADRVDAAMSGCMSDKVIMAPSTNVFVGDDATIDFLIIALLHLPSLALAGMGRPKKCGSVLRTSFSLPRFIIAEAGPATAFNGGSQILFALHALWELTLNDRGW
jgi:hypothetical protein